jgi:hypothetical protein
MFVRSLTLLFAAKIMGFAAFHDDVIRRSRNRPFLAVGIITRLADWIVGDHVVAQFFRPRIGNLVRFAGAEEKRIACDDFGRASCVPHLATTGDDEIKFRLRGVRVIRAESCAGRNVLKRQIKRMAFCEVE